MEKLKLQKIIMEILSYILLHKRTKTYIDQILKLEGLKKNPVALTIGTIKENFNISMEKREAGLKVLMRKVYSFLEVKKLHLMKHKVLLLKL